MSELTERILNYHRTPFNCELHDMLLELSQKVDAICDTCRNQLGRPVEPAMDGAATPTAGGSTGGTLNGAGANLAEAVAATPPSVPPAGFPEALQASIDRLRANKYDDYKPISYPFWSHTKQTDLVNVAQSLIRGIASVPPEVREAAEHWLSMVAAYKRDYPSGWTPSSADQAVVMARWIAGLAE